MRWSDKIMQRDKKESIKKGILRWYKKLNLDKYIRRIDWYIIKKFLGTYFFAIALIISIAVVFDVNENIDRFINNKAPIEAIVFDYYMNFVPYFSISAAYSSSETKYSITGR